MYPVFGEQMSQSPDLDRLRAEYADRRRRLAGSVLYSRFNLPHLFLLQQRERATIALLKRHGLVNLAESRVLELGCGEGGVLVEYLGYGASPRYLHGTDLLPDRIALAQDHLPLVSFSCADGQFLPYADSVFDLVLQYTVFSSILDASIKQGLAREMLRVLRPEGLILWYDFWLNPSNPQTKGIRPAEIRSLFPDSKFDFCRITLAPPISRRLVPISWLFSSFLERLALFNTHYLFAISRRSQDEG